MTKDITEPNFKQRERERERERESRASAGGFTMELGLGQRAS